MWLKNSSPDSIRHFNVSFGDIRRLCYPPSYIFTWCAVDSKVYFSQHGSRVPCTPERRPSLFQIMTNCTTIPLLSSTLQVRTSFIQLVSRSQLLVLFAPNVLGQLSVTRVQKVVYRLAELEWSSCPVSSPMPVPLLAGCHFGLACFLPACQQHHDANLSESCLIFSLPMTGAVTVESCWQ
jgi:hypothetical protein